jgi:hypothetical protein
LNIPFSRLSQSRREPGIGRYLVQTTLMLAFLLTMTIRDASAHAQDRTLQLSNAAAGPFQVTVWTAPGILRTGEIHVEAAVIGADGAPMRSVLVQVDVSSLDAGTEVLTTTAYPAVETNGVTREAAFILRDAGDYEVTITILGADGASGQATFPIEVIRVANSIRFGLHGLMMVSILTSVWMIREGIKIWSGKIGSTITTIANKARRTTR